MMQQQINTLKIQVEILLEQSEMQSQALMRMEMQIQEMQDPMVDRELSCKTCREATGIKNQIEFNQKMEKIRLHQQSNRSYLPKIGIIK